MEENIKCCRISGSVAGSQQGSSYEFPRMRAQFLLWFLNSMSPLHDSQHLFVRAEVPMGIEQEQFTMCNLLRMAFWCSGSFPPLVLKASWGLRYPRVLRPGFYNIPCTLS